MGAIVPIAAHRERAHVTPRSRTMTAPALQRYANRHGDSGVTAYAIDDDAIAVEFGHGPVYVYARRDIGARHFAALCAAAQAGRGLSTWISQHVQSHYAAHFDDRAAWRAWRTAAPQAAPSPSKR